MMFRRQPGIRLAFATLLVAMAPWRVQAELSEQEVKAAFLVNFAQFTEWPAATFANTAAPILIGVTGDETVRYAIDRLAKNKLFNGRALKTRKVKDANDVTGAHLLFVGDLAGSRTADVLKALTGLPVLTVGDADGFCAQGGMIGFLHERDRLRFEIRFDVTEQAGLRISSRVLALAKTVHGKK